VPIAPANFGELVQIVYCSRSLLKGTAEISAGIADILAVSHRNNARDEITGALFFNGRWFAQTLEGRPLALANRYAQILRDKRHTDICLLQHDYIPERCFNGWTMAYLDGGDGAAFTLSPGFLRDIAPSGGPAGPVLELMRYVMTQR
jgi:hypothetical protein